MQILEEMERPGVGDIDAVQEGQEIQDAQKWDQTPVDAGDHLPLRGVRRAADLELIILGVRSAGMVGVVTGDRLNHAALIIGRFASYRVRLA